MTSDRPPSTLTLWQRTKRMLLVAVAFFPVFFGIIPAAGHEILLANNYYGLGDSRLTKPENIQCGLYRIEKKKGRFLFIYPYAAYISTGCGYHGLFSGHYDYVQYAISVRPPHTFLTKLAEIPAESQRTQIVKSESMAIDRAVNEQWLRTKGDLMNGSKEQ